MNLKNALEIEAAGRQKAERIRIGLSFIGAPELVNQVSDALDSFATGRATLVRDVAAAIAQKILEVESLRLLQDEAPDAPFQAAYLRKLAKDIVLEIHGLDVAKVRDVAAEL